MPANPSLQRTPVPDGADVAPSGSRGRLVAAAVWLLLAVCVAGSVAGAVAQRSSVRSGARQAFRATSGDVAAAMASALRRETDFAATMGSTMAVWPGMTNAQFARWITGTEAMTLYPGGIGYGFIAHVPATELAAFGRRLGADPAPGDRKRVVIGTGHV